MISHRPRAERHMVAFILAVALAACRAGGGAKQFTGPARNLLPNASFENGTRDWTAGAGARASSATSHVRDGTRSVAIVATTPERMFFRTQGVFTVPVKPNTTYVGSIYVEPGSISRHVRVF